MRLRIRFGIRLKLVVAFALAITLPIGALVGFYTYSAKNIMEHTDAKLIVPPFTKEVADSVGDEFTKTGNLHDAVLSLKDFYLPPGVRIEVLDTEGRIVFDTMGNSVGSKVSFPELARKMLMPSNAPKEQYHMGAPVTANGSDVGVVLVSFPVTIILEPLTRGIKLTGLIGLGTALLVIFLLGWILSKGIISPLKNLVIATEKISQGDFETRVQVKSKDEIGRLGTALNRMVEELKNARQREKDLELSRRELIANVSHDLRTPLSSIRGYVEGLLDGVVAAEPEKTRRYLEVIHDKALSLERLINDLFKLSRLESGQLKMELFIVNAGEMLKELCVKFSRDAAVAGLSFNCQIADNLPSVNVDIGRIEQVLANLLQNSLRHTHTGGEIAVKAEASGKEIIISVLDNGEGIAPEDLPHVFKRLYTGEKSRSRVKGGTGLGLAIAREIIQAHGGRVWAESEKGSGSTFYFTLPVLEVKTLIIAPDKSAFKNENFLMDILQVKIKHAGYENNKKAIKNINFTLRKGELIGLIGPNGAGKSTTIKAILGLLPELEGEVCLTGQNTKYAYIPEQPVFYDEFTLWEHLELAASAYGMERKEFLEEGEKLLKIFGLQKEKHHLPGSFSKGMRQKVMLIIGFLSKADIYIVDEPFIGLDPRATRDFLELLNSEKMRGAGILISTHALDMAERICDSIVLMAEGELVTRGNLGKIRELCRMPEASLFDCFIKILESVK